MDFFLSNTCKYLFNMSQTIVENKNFVFPILENNIQKVKTTLIMTKQLLLIMVELW